LLDVSTKLNDSSNEALPYYEMLILLDSKTSQRVSGSKKWIGASVVVAFLVGYVAYSVVSFSPASFASGWHCTSRVPTSGTSFYLNSDLQDSFFAPIKSMKSSMPAVADIRRNQNTFVDASPSFFICLAPKTGCTSWTNFFLYVNDDIMLDSERAQRTPGYVYTDYRSKVIGHKTAKLAMPDEQLEQLYHSQDRFVVSRNPYVRFLSSYQDWMSRTHVREEQVSFGQFLEIYKSRNFSMFPAAPIDHIDPITSYCRFDQMGGYKVLRVEEQALWFESFLERYRMTEQMKNYTGS